MHNIEYWKIEYWQVATDIALACSLMFLGYRLSRGTRSVADTGKLVSVEGSLRSLLADAGEASKDLNQQLVKRQQTLEKLLFDLQSTESRINRSVSSADEQRQALSAQIENSRATMLDLSRSVASVNATRGPSAAYVQGYAPTNSPIEPSYIPVVRGEVDAFEQLAPEPPSFENVVHAAPPTNRPAVIEPPNRAAAKSPKTNIYGEILDSEETAPSSFEPRMPKAAVSKPQTLASTIEKQVSGKTTQETLEQLYGAAERMLRAGKEVERVALQTDLPIDEVRILSQLIMKERDAEQAPAQVVSTSKAQDDRLGVLGGIRRQVQTL